MHSLTGTLRLVRLALRRDRIKLPAWILALVAMVAANIPAVMNIYGKTPQTEIEYAATTAPSLVSRIFGGPIQGAQIGEIVINETFLFTAIAIAFMSTLAIVRHTRQNEETGRLELIGSAVVARHASMAAALVVTIGANLVLGALLALVLIANDLPVAGSLGMAAALSAVGITFAGIAAITAQISESARGANSLAAMAIGVAFLLRAIGDSLGQLTADKMGVLSAWPSWLSPLGWGQQLHPYTVEKWWVFGLFGGLFVASVFLAFYLNAHRDLGSGLLQARKGPAQAPKALLGTLGLARRLQRGTLIGWAIGIGIMGSMLGLISKEFAQMFEENPDLQAYVGALGGSGKFDDVFFAAMFAIMGICIGGYVIQTLQRLRSEEANGTLEPVLATSVSRPRWMLSHVGYAMFGAVVLLLVMGVTAALSYILAADGTWADFGRLVGAAFVSLPALLVISGMGAVLFGAAPRAFIAMSWSVFGICLLIGQFGELLKLPQAIKNISPFSHIPAAPSESVEVLPLAILTALGLALLAAGLAFFRRRNLTVG